MKMTKKQISTMLTIANDNGYVGNVGNNAFWRHYFRTDAGCGIMSSYCMTVFMPDPVPGLLEMKEDGCRFRDIFQDYLDASYLVDFNKDDMVNWKRQYKKDRSEGKSTTRIGLHTVNDIRASESLYSEFEYIKLMRLIHAVGGTPELRISRLPHRNKFPVVLALSRDWDYHRDTIDQELTFGMLLPLRPQN